MFTDDIINRFVAKIDKTPGLGPNGDCWEWVGATNEKGYGKVTINSKCKRVHRIAYEIFIGKIDKGLMVLHKCDNPSCCNPEHLWLGTAADNSKDMKHKLRQTIGEKNFHAKLTAREVKAIRSNIKSIRSCKERAYEKLAEQYNVSKQTIKDIVLHRSWRHL